ncbi:hypothetical protein [Streptomyces specialis]|uniref:hypothetical protein n=1 Tax=Streptomyces specialis TaxID=498367 RepID=UPI000AB5F8D4|nr:hypothetical protein [Streptomyces specialis]
MTKSMPDRLPRSGSYLAQLSAICHGLGATTLSGPEGDRVTLGPARRSNSADVRRRGR